VLKNCVSVDLNRYLSVTDFCMKISTPGQRSSSFKKSCTVWRQHQLWITLMVLH